ncbi:MAG: amidohydrolase family protein [Candidatus Riflebacteria bacterium]|nr:amidohydrolase family protein [Candidatus Riflebacteria bacterium]
MTRRYLTVLSTTLVLLLCVCSVQAAEPSDGKPQAKLIYVKTGKLFDGLGETLRENMTIIVENERIKEIVPTQQASVPVGVAVLDLSKAVVLPGLIDCHVHLGSPADRPDDLYQFERTSQIDAIYGVINAKKTLLAGFTAVRQFGGSPFVGVDLRNSIDRGLIQGPRIITSGPNITMTGGHSDFNGYPYTTRLREEYRPFFIADGVDEMRRVVRTQIKYGADVIKMIGTGGVMSNADNPNSTQYSFEEIKAGAETAHRAGRKLAVHAHSAQGIKDAILAGADSVEHASFADPDGLRLAIEHGTYFVMDIYNDDYILAEGKKNGMPADQIEKEKGVGHLQRETFTKALKAGVKLAFGTDAGMYPHGDNAKQFDTMVRFGMTPAQAIKAATVNAADLLGRSKDFGSIEPGKFADFIAVEGDPLKDVRLLENVGFVMKGGKVYKDQIASSPIETW